MKKRGNAGEVFVLLLLLNIPVFLLAGFVHNHEESRKKIIQKYGELPPQVVDKRDHESVERRKAWFSDHGLDPGRWNENIYKLSKESKLNPLDNR